MVKILHTSDWHLGHQLHGVPRDREHGAFLGWLVGVCEREAIELVLITGDVFDGSNPPATAQAMYFGFLAEMAARGTEVIVIAGNHDSPARLEAPATLLRRMRVHVVGMEPRVIAVPGGDVLAVPYLRVGDVREAFAGTPWIVMAHLHVSGGEPSLMSERRVVIGGEEAIGGDVFPPSAAYVALGHLHKPQRVGGREHVRYAGSPIPLAMGEARYRHQVVVVEPGVSVRTLEIPRTVDLMRIGGATVDDVLAEILRLPVDLGEDPELRPYLEVQVRLDRPVPQLRARIEEAMIGRRPRLVKITVERAGDGEALADAQVGVALADLEPRDVLVRRWRRDHEGEPPTALARAFDELVLRVQS